jgi:hypothetical protein
MESMHCLTCEHYLYGDTCEAFDKIPVEILLGENLHTEPYEGDKGIQYKKA